MRKALIVWGGWNGHQPKEVAEIFRGLLARENFDVEVRDTLDAFREEAMLRALHLIVPIWTMGKILPEQLKPICAAVREAGVGIAGCHGGMCDAFRESTEWQFMHVLVGGTPAVAENSTPVWQYRQSMPSVPA